MAEKLKTKFTLSLSLSRVGAADGGIIEGVRERLSIERIQQA
jgi:hypothetical protein